MVREKEDCKLKPNPSSDLGWMGKFDTPRFDFKCISELCSHKDECIRNCGSSFEPKIRNYELEAEKGFHLVCDSCDIKLK